ncbi:MAG: non-heme iron oxygenase ferredoxin subunit [Spirochaetales bacterium]|nr:non-heme iron oxygenase ferredoxin subunit [Spirochaetales bacterium]
MWKETVAVDSFRTQKSVTIDGNRYALFKLEGEVYCLDDVCSHEYSLLSEGEVWDREVYCPKHGSRFDIATGAVRSFPATEPVTSYPVEIRDGVIYINTDRR